MEPGCGPCRLRLEPWAKRLKFLEGHAVRMDSMHPDADAGGRACQEAVIRAALLMTGADLADRTGLTALLGCLDEGIALRMGQLAGRRGRAYRNSHGPAFIKAVVRAVFYITLIDLRHVHDHYRLSF